MVGRLLVFCGMVEEAVEFFQVHPYPRILAGQRRTSEIGRVGRRRTTVINVMVVFVVHRSTPAAPVAITTTVQELVRNGFAPAFPLVSGS